MAFDLDEQKRKQRLADVATIEGDALMRHLDAIANTYAVLAATQMETGTWAAECAAAGRTADAAELEALLALQQKAVGSRINPVKIARQIAASRQLANDPPHLLGMVLVDGSGDAVPTE